MLRENVFPLGWQFNIPQKANKQTLTECTLSKENIDLKVFGPFCRGASMASCQAVQIIK
jgi:hypothetical protein